MQKARKPALSLAIDDSASKGASAGFALRRARRSKSRSHAAISSLRLGVKSALANSRRSASSNSLRISWPRRRGTTGLFSAFMCAPLLRPNSSFDDSRALAAVLLDLALDPPDEASPASYEDQLRARFQGALAARSARKLSSKDQPFREP